MSALAVLELEAARWRAVLESARDAIISIDAGGKITLFNRAAEETFGYRADEVIGRNVACLMPPPYREEHDGYIARYAATGDARAIGRIRDVEGRRKSGEVFPLELSVSEARVGDGVTYSAILRDVTEQRRMERELRLRAAQQAATAELGVKGIRTDVNRLMADAVDLVARTLNLQHVKVLELTPEGERLLLRAGVGWREGLVGHATVEIGPDSQAGYVLRSRQPVVVTNLPTESRFHGTSMLHDHGIVSGVSVMIHGLQGPYGILSAHAQSARTFGTEDVDFVQAIANVLAEAIERERAQAESEHHRQTALQRQRLADIGALTTKIVHDIGNPLAGVSMLAAQLKRCTVRNPAQAIVDSTAAIDQLGRTVRHLDAMVADFKGFAREQRLKLEEIRLPALLEEVANFWEPEAAARDIALTFDPDDPPPVWADRDKLRRVLDNLVKNALEAIERGPGAVSIASNAPDLDRVRIVIADTGPGIPDGIDVFRLFETTKPHGTGLGLPIVRQIVAAHGGGVEFTRREPRGTIFRIELPVGGPGGIMLLEPVPDRRL
ncbi:MAG TPA: PAS domain S-box protein [Candidatus Binatia bacterium]